LELELHRNWGGGAGNLDRLENGGGMREIRSHDFHDGPNKKREKRRKGVPGTVRTRTEYQPLFQPKTERYALKKKRAR